MKRVATLLAAVFVLTSCEDVAGPNPGDSAPAFLISDGAHDGNQHFFFLPPMVPQPSYSGVFDGSLAPVVRIRSLDAAPPPSDFDGSILFHIGPAGGGAGDWDIYRMSPDGTGIVALTDDGFDNRVGAVSPDGGRVAFTSNRSGDYAIHTMSIEGLDLSPPLVTLQRCCGEAQWSPDGTQLAFSDGPPGLFEIFIADIADPNAVSVRQLTAVGFAERATWSLDGTRLAFGAMVTGGWQLHTIGADGTGLVALTPGAGWSPSWNDMYPRWCASGRIAFQSRRTGRSAIHSMRPDGSDVQQVTPAASENYDQPVCSPTGDWLGYRAHDRADLYRIAADGSSNLLLYDGVDHTGITSWGTAPSPAPTFDIMLAAAVVADQEHYQVNWHTNEYDLDPETVYRISVAVDGSQLGFADVKLGANMGVLKNVNTDEYVPLKDGRTLPIKFRIEEGAVSSPSGTLLIESDRLYLLEADGSGIVPAAAGVMHADLSPDKSRIIYTRAGTQSLWIAHVDGSNEVLISAHSAPQYVPHWSRDATRIVWTREVTWGVSAREIFTMSSEGTGVTRLTNNAVMDHDGQWSPDGTRIIFYSQRDGPGDIYAMNADGSNTVRLTAGLNAGAPEYSPDGQRVAFVAAPQGALGVYTMAASGEDVQLLLSDPCIAGSEFGVHYSPDGRYIAFSACMSATKSDAYVMRVDGTGVLQLTNTPDRSEVIHTWR